MLILAALLLILLPAGALADEFHGQVIGVADGDTITVLRDRRPERVRLNGIDAPEKGQAFSTRARQFAAALAHGREVTVLVVGRDRYGRALGEVILPDGRALNRELVRAGFAWWFRRYSTDERLGQLEAEARAAKRGLWADPEPIAPWDWRRERQATPAAGRRGPHGRIAMSAGRNWTVLFLFARGPRLIARCRPWRPDPSRRTARTRSAAGADRGRLRLHGARRAGPAVPRRSPRRSGSSCPVGRPWGSAS